jgi:hypothetical protein
MKLRLSSAALVAALYVAPAWPQAPGPAGHEGHHGAKPAAPPAAGPGARNAQVPAPAKAAPPASASGYQSPFAGYRPFNADEPMKDWRRANDEVREAGGHAGLVKGGAKK